MKPIKYLPLARVIKLFLQLGIIFMSIFVIINLIIGLFNLKPYINIGDGSLMFENPADGYRLHANINLHIPDTLVQYQNGEERIYKNEPLALKYKSIEKRIVKEKIVNQILSSEDEDIEISNQISIPDVVIVKVKSKNWIYNLFWNVSAQLDQLFTILIFVILIKLVNRYKDQKIFENRSFKLISFMGWLLIIMEIFNFVISLINGRIIEHPQLNSFSTIDPKAYNHLTFELNFYNSFSLVNVGIGILIVLLAEVFRVAILAKKENEMTI
ncbi:DUF2975 domain-containing protein [Pedobacter sp. Hv1]|uniref:DUF2975 domain-containing protein n=1 Tax=Pedobacter sp. Hv1 TaxID=1740090 RepID=UPI0006D8BAB1|nr:DUF2975 domain-containing protein [Pedobacter sp. Hv1]KQC02141.1 hypothetical protein AQF98_00780 [Pedobacter sp. Hv1]